MNYSNLLTNLGMETRLDMAEAIRTGSCTIEFDGSLNVTIEAGDSGAGQQSVAYVHAVVGRAPASAEMLFGRLLQIQLFGIATADGAFSFQQETRDVLFFRTLRLEALSQAEALVEMSAFVDQASRWREHFPKLAEQGDDAEAAPPNALAINV